mmetsp:Transcript_22794/g.33381  ORF Transcript_22794/g.33381 Transcript_22794/m.33381 type:complete len:176 (+) Transcript_22794:53-580(+)|eukprot:CAMPEP_0197234602 /NCGR_PEP_ID=MMETSP1429-20130617/2309_1 /TAXON_ID=49237 /ORGANISM="Chaetoceros  sp., Strain UNC1202" /LENGTH=175 /DNA_ID=CAMNT_0042693047 /DNA_START=53 /DNA_END=580 /DNA_ORIENTATION=-
MRMPSTRSGTSQHQMCIGYAYRDELTYMENSNTSDPSNCPCNLCAEIRCLRENSTLALRESLKDKFHLQEMVSDDLRMEKALLEEIRDMQAQESKVNARTAALKMVNNKQVDHFSSRDSFKRHMQRELDSKDVEISSMESALMRNLHLIREIQLEIDNGHDESSDSGSTMRTTLS